MSDAAHKTVKKTRLLPEHEGGAVIDSANRAAKQRLDEASRFEADTKRKFARCQAKIKLLAASLDGIEQEKQQAVRDCQDRISSFLTKIGIVDPQNVSFESVDKSRPFDVIVTWEEAVKADPPKETA